MPPIAFSWHETHFDQSVLLIYRTNWYLVFFCFPLTLQWRETVETPQCSVANECELNVADDSWSKVYTPSLLSMSVHHIVLRPQCLWSRLTSTFPSVLCPTLHLPLLHLSSIFISPSSQDHPAQCDFSTQRAQHLLPSKRGCIGHVPQMEGQQGQGQRIHRDHQVCERDK